MKRLLNLVLAVVLFSLIGCVKILNDDLKTKETKMVLNAAISPDSLYTVNISRTFNIFEDESAHNLPFIDSAKVKLYEDGKFLSDLKNVGYGYYINPGFYPEIGKEYKIESSYGSLKSIESKTIIPPVVRVADFDTVVLQYFDEYNGYEEQYIGVLKYNDPENVDNQYLLSCKVAITDVNGNVFWYDQGIWPIEGDDRFFDGSANGKLLWSDKYSNGNEVTVRFVFYSVYKYDEGRSRDTEKVHFVFSLQSVNFDYYTYLKSYDVYWESGGGEDPFAEPVVVHSNVENGYGIFGGYSQDTVSTNIFFTYDGDGKGGDR